MKILKTLYNKYFKKQPVKLSKKQLEEKLYLVFKKHLPDLYVNIFKYEDDGHTIFSKLDLVSDEYKQETLADRTNWIFSIIEKEFKDTSLMMLIIYPVEYEVFENSLEISTYEH
jgi:hypothetical protein